MKKAKIMLSALAVVAVVGGALAFKASRSIQILYTYSEGTCPSISSYQTTALLNAPTTFLYTTNQGVEEAPCPGISTTAYFNAN